MALSATPRARAQQGGDPLRKQAWQTQSHFAQPACGLPSTPSSGQKHLLLLPWSSLADSPAPLPQSIIPAGRREHVLHCFYPLPEWGINGAASPSMPSWPRWDTAAQQNPPAPLRAAHGPAIRVLSLGRAALCPLLALPFAPFPPSWCSSAHAHRSPRRNASPAVLL